MKIINTDKNTILAEDVFVADAMLKRIKGLLGRKELKKNEALIIKPGNSIHTFFMKFSIDVLFLDTQGKVIASINCLKPWRLSPYYWRANSVIELPCGTISGSLTAKGDSINLV